VRDALNIDKDVAGVAISDVDSGSEASKRGLRRGDVIADVNGDVVKDAKDLTKAFESARTKGRKFALLKIIRHKETAYITLPTTEDKAAKAEKKPEPKKEKK
jgi:serine protease Do